MGRLHRLFALLAVAILTAAAPAFAQGEKRVALIVGNSSYRHVPSLANPARDARLMADTLRGLGFALVGGGAQLDLDKAGFDAAVQRFGRELRGADVGLFYYAGHGVQVRGANFLVPVAANPTREADVDFEMLDTNLVLRQMEGAGTRLNLVILDACRNNPFGGRGLRSTSPGLATMQAPEGTLISFATQPGNVALDGSDGNSPYTRALAEAIRRPGLDIFCTFNEVGLQVARTTGGAQQPWVSLSPIKGEFFFAGRAIGGEAAALAKLRHGMSYSNARIVLTDGGWQPARFPWQTTDDRCAHRKDVCSEYIETEGCSGTGMGYCRFKFGNAFGKKLFLITVGEEVESLQIERWWIE